MSNNLKVIPLTKSMLIEAIGENTYWQNNRILIPKSKALWLIKNDRIENNDYCAVIGIENTNIIGYTLIVPDLIQLKNGIVEKINWIHEWWVHEKYNGSVISSYIFNETVKLLDNKLLLESNAESANHFFDLHFKTISKRFRNTIFFKLESSIIIHKYSFLKYFKIFIDLIDNTLIRLLNYRSYSKTQNSLKDINYEYLNELDLEAWAFVEEECKNDFTLKTRSYVNWLLDNSQYLQTPISKRFNYKFSTTGFSNNIHSHTLKIIKNHKVIGVLNYLFNMIEFNIRFFLVRNTVDYNACVGALMEHFFKSNATYIITDDLKLCETISKNYFNLFVHKNEKRARAHKDLKLNFENIVMTDRDGRFH